MSIKKFRVIIRAEVTKKDDLIMRKKLKTQGELLEDLQIWTGLSQEEFSRLINKSRTWFQLNRVKKRLFRKAIAEIYLRVKGIPAGYFDGKTPLPPRNNMGNEPNMNYVNDSIERLNAEIERLKNELLEASRLIIKLQQEKFELLRK